ncbi:MAG TPA: NAD(P)-dependent oxidoreductase [Solirubrobacteraceae bacterium]|jgi:UDP-glucose 4-epimerase|nr:NAD(P)-dependent oxidoreductase [Solirubrobacteraceae bacterium]
MRILVTGSSGHLGEALMRVLGEREVDLVGLDVLPSPFTTVLGSVADRGCVRRCLAGADAVVHTATLHKPHVSSHRRSEFVDVNVTGTLNLLEEAVAAGVGRFVFTSTTSAFGRALTPADGEPAAWITEEVRPVPRNIYGTTKTAAEDLCELVARDHGLPCLILRTSRFFPEGDDVEDRRAGYHDLNLKVNELLYRRVDLEDVVSAHLLALERAPALGFGRYIISATTPFAREDNLSVRLSARRDLPSAVRRLFPDYEEIYDRRGWKMLPGIDRIYVNERARHELGWSPVYDFRHALDLLAAGEDPRSTLARAVGAKGYHASTTGVYTARLAGRAAFTGGKAAMSSGRRTGKRRKES